MAERITCEDCVLFEQERPPEISPELITEIAKISPLAGAGLLVRSLARIGNRKCSVGGVAAASDSCKVPDEYQQRAS